MDTETMPTADGLSLQSDAGGALSSPTIVGLFREQVVRLAARTALRQPVDGVWQEVSWDEDGLLLQDPRDLDTFGEAVRHLLGEPPYAMQLGKNARARAQAEFLGDRHLAQWAQLFAQLEANKR